MTGILIAAYQIVLVWGPPVLVLATVIALAVLNRAAGNHLFGFCTRGKPAVYVAPLVGLIAWCWLPWLQAAAWAAAFLFWRVWEHGRWIDLKNDPADLNRIGVERTRFERYCECWAFGSDLVALFWRHLTIWPVIILVWLTGGPFWLVFAGPPLAVALAASHWLAKRLFPNNFHWFAEGLHGALIGIVLMGSALC